MLDREYILDHLAVHNYESFGRSINALILEEALEQLGNDKKEKVEVQITAIVEPAPRGTIYSTAYVNGKPVRVHQPTTPDGGTPV